MVMGRNFPLTLVRGADGFPLDPMSDVRRWTGVVEAYCDAIDERLREMRRTGKPVLLPRAPAKVRFRLEVCP